MMEKIRTWPRWVRYGLLSGIVAGALNFAGHVFIRLSGGPIFFLSLILGWLPVGINSLPIHVLSTAVIWVLIGGVLGRYIEKPLLAGGIWLGLYFLGGTGVFYLARYLLFSSP
jgi:hypothetical protein